MFRSIGSHSMRAVGLLAASLLFAPSVSSVSVSPADVSEGATTTGTVFLTGAVGPTTVELGSNNTNVATVPSSVSAVSSSANFAVKGIALGCAKISAAVARTTSSRSTMVFVKPPASSPLAVTLSTGGVVGGNTTTATVSLIEAMGTPSQTVQLASIGSASVPPTVTLPPGTPNETGIAVAKANFSITTSSVGSTTCAVITATHGAAQGRAVLKILSTSG